MDKKSLLTPDLRERLREERLRLGYSQAEFAEAAGIKRSSQYLYENREETYPNIRYLDAIHQLGADIVYILLGLRIENIELVLADVDRACEAYRKVEELAQDPDGNMLPLDVRVKIFAALYKGLDNEITNSLQTLKVG